MADPAAETKDLEILGHGPIHEAFAQPASAMLESIVVVKKKPPETIEELPPDVKPEGDNVVWLPGYWAFDNERDDFIWGGAVSGGTCRRNAFGSRATGSAKAMRFAGFPATGASRLRAGLLSAAARSCG